MWSLRQRVGQFWMHCGLNVLKPSTILPDSLQKCPLWRYNPQQDLRNRLASSAVQLVEGSQATPHKVNAHVTLCRSKPKRWALGDSYILYGMVCGLEFTFLTFSFAIRFTYQFNTCYLAMVNTVGEEITGFCFLWGAGIFTDPMSSAPPSGEIIAPSGKHVIQRWNHWWHVWITSHYNFIGIAVQLEHAGSTRINLSRSWWSKQMAKSKMGSVLQTAKSRYRSDDLISRYPPYPNNPKNSQKERFQFTEGILWGNFNYYFSRWTKVIFTVGHGPMSRIPFVRDTESKLGARN